jgi:protein-tyrosine phosphatase
MKQVGQRPLWFGGVSELRDVAALHDAGIEAVLFLATDLINLPGRGLIVCRVPLIDGQGNEPERLRLAVDIAASLVGGGVLTLVCCSNGMSRSPAIVAAALAEVDGGSADEHLKRLTLGQPADVSPALWRDIRSIVP